MATLTTNDPDLKEEIVLEAINETKGRFFGIEFEKKDGTMRKMNARTHPDDQPSNWNPEKKGMRIVWDVQKGGFRTITAKSVKRFTFASKTITFD